MSQDLDRAVALEVMGWGRGAVGDASGLQIGCGLVSDRGATFIRLASGVKTFEPSADIADAWRVVERMRALGWWVSLEPCDRAFYEDDEGLGAFAPGWAAEIRRPETDTECPEAYEENVTAPEAICRAALEAVRAMKGAGA